ncbi:Serine/threonine-protein phosphatase 2A activator [Trichostrongylus colubriformis]|uniref:Serine/threonine-protein phosphatase 2A activator n=1 Tax=Trichostrongylus colubriformis TaxID=6319 RepID=A0AAN8FLC6_TRICO
MIFGVRSIGVRRTERRVYSIGIRRTELMLSRSALSKNSMISYASSSAAQSYQLLLEFLHELNDAVLNVKTCDDVAVGDNAMKLIEMLDTLLGWTDLYPPEESMDQRYGNKSYRKWFDHLQNEMSNVLTSFLPDDMKPASIELCAYLGDSFGNATRIDYGSGHESCFAIFLLCLYRIGFLTSTDHQAIVLRVFVKYLYLCRSLQTMYKMEPAGSQGVHSIDDFQFIPFLWGSAQLANNKSLVPDSYLKAATVEANAHKYLFFDCVNFINQTKSGPFYQHSNQLWNISAVPTWTKVNSGLFKMYEGEVLKKFPVVQHFRFGSLFSFEERPNAGVPPTETTSQVASAQADTERMPPPDKLDMDSHMPPPAQPTAHAHIPSSHEHLPKIEE